VACTVSFVVVASWVGPAVVPIASGDLMAGCPRETMASLHLVAGDARWRCVGLGLAR
jgi:hypothetical protein